MRNVYVKTFIMAFGLFAMIFCGNAITIAGTQDAHTMIGMNVAGSEDAPCCPDRGMSSFVMCTQCPVLSADNSALNYKPLTKPMHFVTGAHPLVGLTYKPLAPPPRYDAA